jgi:hypothetical protein
MPLRKTEMQIKDVRREKTSTPPAEVVEDQRSSYGEEDSGSDGESLHSSSSATSIVQQVKKPRSERSSPGPSKAKSVKNKAPRRKVKQFAKLTEEQEQNVVEWLQENDFLYRKQAPLFMNRTAKDDAFAKKIKHRRWELM